jgi:hypothetical protein
MNKKIVIAILTVLILSIVIVYVMLNSGYFFPSRNIAIINITLPETNICVGTMTNVTVNIMNKGTQNETFTVTAYYNTTLLGTKTVTALKSSTEISLLYNWNTTGLAPANYYIKAECTTVPSETNTTDNTYIYGTVRVRNKPTYAKVEIYPNPRAGFVGKNATISVNISDVSDLYEWKFKLSWNPAIAEIINVVQGSFLQNRSQTFFPNPTINNTAGTSYASCTLLGDIPGASGNGTLATITFHIKTTGTCELNLQDVILSSSLDEEMVNTPDSGTLQAF